MDDIVSPLMPVIHADKYLVSEDLRSITPADKEAFLNAYYLSGNKTLAAKKVGRAANSFAYAATVDKMFAIDFQAVKDAMKHNLEQTMYQNGLTTKGYMDRITWLRKNFPAEYNPAYNPDKDKDAQEALKELSSKLEKYELIPKKNVIEGQEI